MRKLFKELFKKHFYGTGYVVLMVIFILLYKNFDFISSIKDLPTWMSSIASFLAVYVAVIKDKKQEDVLISSDLFFSKENKLFIEFLNKRTSKGFFRCAGIFFIRNPYKNPYKMKKAIIVPEYILKDFLDDDWKTYKSISADRVSKMYLYNGIGDYRIQNIYDKISGLHFTNENYKRYKKKTEGIHSLDEYYLGFRMETNDNADDFYVYVGITELKSAGIIR